MSTQNTPLTTDLNGDISTHAPQYEKSSTDSEESIILNENKKEVYEAMLAFSNYYSSHRTDEIADNVDVSTDSGMTLQDWRNIPDSMKEKLLPLMSRYFQLKECKLMMQEEQSLLLDQMTKVCQQSRSETNVRKKLQKWSLTHGRKAAIGKDPFKLMRRVVDKYTIRSKTK
eukprot:CAMPEP_0117441128 /NCGR_PEP_ID=MMETSP0759-20121206/3472_1 /TAXON_ID=63605 /ORGANISM="Percolomonas cosmopolitus, Strain WS" /LENGTH=170 /DNA_ID=CAMNT_0005232967 /DNA_START=35 /DNA_END=547 /DNA_ORIENTATION=+